MVLFEDLNDYEWELVEPLVSEDDLRQDKRGRPRIEMRGIVNAILWVITTGESWTKLPGRYPSAPTCKRRFEVWRENGVLSEINQALTPLGRKISLRKYFASTIKGKGPVIPGIEKLRNAFWTNPDSWKAPIKVH